MAESEFNKIAGYEEEKKELCNICSLIKRNDELKAVGGQLPRGVFLVGPNGVGKTVLAKAFIKESNCQTVVIDYNDIDDDNDFLFYVKAKFKEAANKVPCILYIDELDKLIGLHQEYFDSDNMDRSRIILNEINKYSNIDGLFLLIVANKTYKLDFSIIRSGRIDRIIELDMPDENERKAIIEYYSKNKKMTKGINYSHLSKIFKNFSGADIESTLNNAVIISFTDGRSETTEDDVLKAYYDKVFSNNSKELKLDSKSLEMVAYHEAGHAVVNYLKNPNSITNVSLIRRGGIKGFVNRHESECVVRTLQDKVNQIAISLGGLIAEEVFFQQRTDGAVVDIRKARAMAMSLVRDDGYSGFDKTAAPLSYADDEMFSNSRTSELRLERIEKAEDDLIDKIYNETTELITKSKTIVTALAKELIEKRFLNKNDVERILKNNAN